MFDLLETTLSILTMQGSALLIPPGLLMSGAGSCTNFCRGSTRMSATGTYSFRCVVLQVVRPSWQ